MPGHGLDVRMNQDRPIALHREPTSVRSDPRTTRPRPRRLRQHTNPLAFQGATDCPNWQLVLGGPPQELEIGFGLGELLLARAAMRPSSRICGIDVRWAYVERVREAISRNNLQLPNLHFIHAEGTLALTRWIASESLEHVIVYFPDPWFKKRHAKRRIIRRDTAALIAQALTSGGLVHIATDQAPLAAEMMTILSAEPLLMNVMGGGKFAPRSVLGCMSGREEEHLRRGEPIWRLIFCRRG
jgi:tRNA (guanine-N7-)-methyltransferase